MNLLSNATKCSPAGGAITGRLTRAATAGRTRAVLVVADAGMAIPASDLPRQYRMGHWSMMRRQPRRQAPMLSTPAHILVIDAEDDLCAFFESLLSSEGYVVDCAPSAAAVHDLLATTRPDLVISDLGWTSDGRADFGILALLDASEQHHGLPVLFCTAWDARDMAPQVAALGRPHTALLAKPFDLDVLLGAIARGCAGVPMTPPPGRAVDANLPAAAGTGRVLQVAR